MLPSERKKALISAMKKTCDGADWITREELSKSLGYKNKRYAGQVLAGLPRFNTKYLIEEVAERLMEVSEVKN